MFRCKSDNSDRSGKEVVVSFAVFESDGAKVYSFVGSKRDIFPLF